MKEIDKLMIERKLNFIKNRLIRLKNFYDDYNKATKEYEQEMLKSAIERLAEEIVESSIKVNITILKTLNKFPSSYQESFLMLSEFLDIDNDFKKKLAKTAKFRNILAHDYMDLETSTIIVNIKNILKLYPKYLLKIEKYLED